MTVRSDINNYLFSFLIELEPYGFKYFCFISVSKQSLRTKPGILEDHEKTKSFEILVQ